MTGGPMSRVERLKSCSVAKVWGRWHLPPPFTCKTDERVGEIWFEPSPRLPDILIKYLFTSAKLSVQVHPGDGDAGEGIAGKDECWLVLDSEPGARLAIGFNEPISREELRAAALNGSIEDRLTWHTANQGDFFYLPAGTVHAIGAGISLVEVQQNTPITYRLFDYGRPRELHLDQALVVAAGEPYPDELYRSTDEDVETCLVNGPYFRLDQLVGKPSDDLLSAHSGFCQILPLAGSVLVDGVAIAPTESAIATSLHAVGFEACQRCLVVSVRP